MTVPDKSAAIIYLAVGLGVALLAFNFSTHYSIVDDAYITYRYADNWLAGEGLVFNAGDRVEGYTSLLWVLLVAGTRAVGLSPEIGSTLLSVIALGVVLWAVQRTVCHLTSNVSAGWSAVILTAGSLQLARWAGSGMETVCFAALLALANERLAARGAHNTASSALYGLSVLARPPGALHAGVAFAVALARVRRFEGGVTRLSLMAALFFVLPLIQLVFRLGYYGVAMPNTYYAKLSGGVRSLVPEGLEYLRNFVLSDGGVLVACAIPVVLLGRRLHWVAVALAGQVLAHTAYVVWVGGDFFPYHRFLVPVIPALGVLAGLAIDLVVRRLGPELARVAPMVAVGLALVQSAAGHFCSQRELFARARAIYAEREMVAEWIRSNMPADAKLAINAAGLIPYRTGLQTIDMLGLNDSHIGRMEVVDDRGAVTFVGHFKHDGAYVFGLSPDIVLTAGAVLHPGRNTEEAALQASVNTFPGDREFLQAAAGGAYVDVVEELAPDRFMVAFVKSAGDGNVAADLDVEPKTGREWFEKGLAHMKSAELETAIEAFERAEELDPDQPVIKLNIAYCNLDLRRFDRAVSMFEGILASHPSYHDARYGLALAHTRRGDRARALQLWRQYLETAPDSIWRQRATKQLRLLEASE